MSKFIDITGQKFGRLTVIEFVNKNKFRESRWLCKCDCGKETIIDGHHLKSGNTKSCGCLKREIAFKIGKLNITHGMRKSRIYNIWNDIIQRSNNPNAKQYKDYGGRGIKVSKRWLKFENFLEDMGEPPSSKYQIDRIDNNKGYYKENCRWATRKEQARNTRKNILITYNNKTQCLIDWAKELNINYKTLICRIKQCRWSIEKAFTTPVNIKRRKQWHNY